MDNHPVIPIIRWTIFMIAALVLSACEGTVEEPGPCDLVFDLLQHLEVTEVRHPAPVLPGTRFDVRGGGFATGTSCVRPEAVLAGSLAADLPAREIPLRIEVVGTSEITATLDDAAADAAGAGDFTGDLVVRFRATDGPASFEVRSAISFELMPNVTPQAVSVQGGDVYLDDPIRLDGSGFLTGEEGATEVTVEGTFTATGGGTSTVSVRLPVDLLEPHDRSSAAFLWSPAIGGLEPGSFEGTVTPENVHTGGERTVGAPAAISTRQIQTVLFGVSPEDASLGRIIEVQGRGFVGPPDGTTTIRLEGVFTPHGGEPEDVEVDLSTTWIDGGRLQYVVMPEEVEQSLVSSDFGATRGRFEGTAVPLLTRDREQYVGLGMDLTLTLGPVRQVVWVRFLPGFGDSLELFGLGAIEDVVRQGILDRMQAIYQPPDLPARWVNVQFVADQPSDYCDTCYAVLDIGGADPNGLGLFAYDNTGTKDVGNLRLYDHVGGENALGAVDGYAYGGVFIDSVLYWSEDPPFDDRPELAPVPDPRFDEVFEPLRIQEVVAGEYPDGATGERRARIEAALSFLVNVVADIGAHEFGHTLGLAQPFDPAGGMHNAVPGEGCLMDAEPERPLEERALLDGNTGARFCGENIEYLVDILPME